MMRTLNYVPWMTILGLLGAGGGYLVGGGEGDQAMIPALYGLCIGCMAGVLVRVVIRILASRSARTPGEESR